MYFLLSLGVPVILTKPHFLDSAKEFLAEVDGLQPDEKQHSTFINIESVRKEILLTYYRQIT